MSGSGRRVVLVRWIGVMRVRVERAARSERAAVVRHLRAKLAGIRSAEKRKRISEEVASDRRHQIMAIIGEIRTGLHVRDVAPQADGVTGDDRGAS